MSAREPAPISVQDGRDLGYASVPQAVVERLRGRLMAAPLARALGASVLVASELNLAQIRDGAPVWTPDKHTLSERLMLSEHAARAALAALEQAAMITVERGRYDGSARLPNRISLISDHGAFCAVTRRTIAAISRQCLQDHRGRPQALAVYLTLVWEANRQRAEHIEEPRKRATVSYPALAGLTGVSEAHVRRVIGGLMACRVLQDVTQRFAETNGRRTAKTWRLVEPPAVERPLEARPERAVTQSPRTDHTVAEDCSLERQGPLRDAPRTAQGCAEDQSPERRGPLNGAPTRAREEQHEQHSATANPHGSQGPGGGGEGDLPEGSGDVAVVVEEMVRMLARRAAGNERRARRRAQDPAWATAARGLFEDGFTASQLAELIAFAETDLAVGHRVTCLPSLNAQLDALQARRSAVGERARPAAVSPRVDALVELVMRSLRQAPPRATRQHHMEIAERLDATLTAEHATFLAGLPWRELGQRDQGTLRHAILDQWRAHEHRRAA